MDLVADLLNVTYVIETETVGSLNLGKTLYRLVLRTSLTEATRDSKSALVFTGM